MDSEPIMVKELRVFADPRIVVKAVVALDSLLKDPADVLPPTLDAIDKVFVAMSDPVVFVTSTAVVKNIIPDERPGIILVSSDSVVVRSFSVPEDLAVVAGDDDVASAVACVADTGRSEQ